jgi:hypothetical protein
MLKRTDIRLKEDVQAGIRLGDLALDIEADLAQIKRSK